MNYNYKIAVIPPYEKDDYLLNTVIDGLLALREEHPGLDFRLPEGYPNPFPKDVIGKHMVPREGMVPYAEDADLIVWSFLKKWTDNELIGRIGRWEKTAVIDGTEEGKDRKYDFDRQREILEDFRGNLHVPESILNTCPLYFKREKPYVGHIMPFPFGIERRYHAYYDKHKKKEKDIDFVCIFGQEEYPRMRRHAREILEAYCDENGFTCKTKQTKGFDFSVERVAGRDEFYEFLARAKVGISVSGGGHDTIRFWETLANNCILLTERINVYEPDSSELAFEKRFFQFNDLYDFEYQLRKAGEFLRSDYRHEGLKDEYREIMERHSSKARVLTILRTARERGVIR